MSQSDTGVSAGIVVFHPDADLLLALIARVSGRCRHVFLYVNGLKDAVLRERLRAMPLTLIEAPHNLGLGEAFNTLALAAKLSGARRLLLLDQDSSAPEGLAAALNGAMDTLQAAGERPAVVGPRIEAPKGEEARYKAPRYFDASPPLRRGDANAVRYVISSGSLIDLDALMKIGLFRADYFIDALDMEWCFRAWASGYSCWCAENVVLEHRIGAGSMRMAGVGPRMPKQSRLRYLTYVRNQYYGLRLAHIPLSWRVRFAAHAARVALAAWIAARGDLGFLWALKLAAWRGLLGVLGPPSGGEDVVHFSLMQRGFSAPNLGAAASKREQ